MEGKPQVFVVEDDADVRESITALLKSRGLASHGFRNAAEFLGACHRNTRGCVIIDVRLPGMSGLDLQQRLIADGYSLPVIIITGHADVPMAVRAMKAGAVYFVEKPFDTEWLMRIIEDALDADAHFHQRLREAEQQRARLALLTPRERQVLHLIADGEFNKVIAARLGMSVSTVETHRKRIKEKLRAESLYDLVRAAEQDTRF